MNSHAFSSEGHPKWVRFVWPMVLFSFCLLKFDCLHYPNFWDEMLSYVEPSHNLAQAGLHRALPWIGSSQEFYSHPRGFYVTLALLYKFLGESLPVGRGIALGFTYLTFCFIYLTGRQVCNALTGLMAVALYFFTPVVFAQSTMCLPDLALTAAGTASLYCAITGRRKAAALWGVYAASLRESSLAILLPIFIYQWREEQDKRISHRALSLVPLLWLGSYFLEQKISIGQWSGHTAAEHFHFNLDFFTSNFSNIFPWLFLVQGRIYYSICVLGLIAVGLLAPGKGWWKKEFGLFLIVIYFFVMGFSLDSGFIYQYLNPALPFLAIMAAWFLLKLARWPSVAVILCGLLVMVDVYYVKDGHFLGSMEYSQVLTTHLEGAKYLEKYHANETILAPWPMLNELSLPYHGYVQKGLKVHNRPDLPFDLVVIASHAHLSSKEILLTVLRENHMVKLKGFGDGNIFYHVYGRAPKPSFFSSVQEP